MELFTIVSDFYNINDFENPFIVDVISLQQFKYLRKFKCTKYIILGFENAVDIFNKDVNIIDLKINEDVYWFYDRNIENWEIKFDVFIKIFLHKTNLKILI